MKNSLQCYLGLCIMILHKGKGSYNVYFEGNFLDSEVYLLVLPVHRCRNPFSNL